MITYLASPYSSPTPAISHERFRQACLASARLMRSGKVVFCPVAMSHPIAEFGRLPTDWGFWQEQDCAFIEACGELVVLRLDGWQESKGVTAEIVIAESMNIRVSYIDP